MKLLLWWLHHLPLSFCQQSSIFSYCRSAIYEKSVLTLPVECIFWNSKWSKNTHRHTHRAIIIITLIIANLPSSRGQRKLVDMIAHRLINQDSRMGLQKEPFYIHEGRFVIGWVKPISVCCVTVFTRVA